jgi:hypothetical protein
MRTKRMRTWLAATIVEMAVLCAVIAPQRIDAGAASNDEGPAAIRIAEQPAD